jgi:hypothetical protein
MNLGPWNLLLLAVAAAIAVFIVLYFRNRKSSV